MQYPANDGALPWAVTVETQPARSQNFLHANRDGALWNNGNFPADGDGVDGARRASKGNNAAGQSCERLVRHRDLVLWRFIEGDVAINADATEACVHPSMSINELLNRLRTARVGEHAVLNRRGKTGIEEIVEIAFHESAKAERVRLRNPCAVIGQVFVHID